MDHKREAQAFIEKRGGEFAALSREIWEYAELSLKEFRSAARYIEKLKAEGFAVTENLGGIATAFSGSFGSGRPVIGILGEFDALSGLSQAPGETAPRPLVPGGAGHGCGHNMLGAAAFAAACGVKRFLETSGLPGTVVFYGCPGEEGGAAKAFLAREGVWKSLDAALSWHPGDTNEITTGTNNSCTQVLYKFKGVAAHAAGDPEHGRSALDAVELMNVGVQFLREHMKDEARIHYAIIDGGGVSPNVVQHTASVLYMVRSRDVPDTLALQARVDKIAAGAALMTETEYDRVFVDGTANVLPNFPLEKCLYANMEALPLPKYTAEERSFAEALRKTYPAPDALPGLGAKKDPAVAEKVRTLSDGGKKPLNDFLLPLYSGEDFTPGSTDVGDVSWLTPAGQFTAVCFPAGAPGHSWQNVSCGGSSVGDKGLLWAAQVLCGAAADLFSDPAILAAAREEFQKRTAAHGYVCPIPADAAPYVIE
ncbi:MAG: amidohydrolase [Oscillospiraceae bacterium]|nr:amidohydrolase [Oscillospiraceae bacterium]